MLEGLAGYRESPAEDPLSAPDALCSSCDEAHDALPTMDRVRYGHRIETLTTDAILDRWT